MEFPARTALAIRTLWRRARSPEREFRSRAAEQPTLGDAVRGLLLARTLPAFLALVLNYAGFQALYGRLTRMEGPLFQMLWDNLPDTVNPADVRAAFHGLPPLPSWSHVLPWLAVLAPLGILSLWLHDAVWDHSCLWLLRGLKARKSFRLSLVADAEALKVGALGAAVGLLGDLPLAGCLFSILLAPVGIYFWVLRGIALAAWHDCPVWKGVVATLLHALLAALFGALTLGSFLFVVYDALRPG
jgi:hypothetical protein